MWHVQKYIIHFIIRIRRLIFDERRSFSWKLTFDLTLCKHLKTFIFLVSSQVKFFFLYFIILAFNIFPRWKWPTYKLYRFLYTSNYFIFTSNFVFSLHSSVGKENLVARHSVLRSSFTFERLWDISISHIRSRIRGICTDTPTYNSYIQRAANVNDNHKIF